MIILVEWVDFDWLIFYLMVPYWDLSSSQVSSTSYGYNSFAKTRYFWYIRVREFLIWVSSGLSRRYLGDIAADGQIVIVFIFNSSKDVIVILKNKGIGFPESQIWYKFYLKTTVEKAVISWSWRIKIHIKPNFIVFCCVIYYRLRLSLGIVLVSFPSSQENYWK